MTPCLLQVHTPRGVSEIRANGRSPAQITDSQVRSTYYELDVSRVPPGEAELMDEDEFQEAALEYGYSEEFQQACYQVAREAIDLANRWVGRGMPAYPA